MPRILVYEHLTALGIGVDPASPDHGMYREGRTMRDTVSADFCAAGCELVEKNPDWAIVIAPEFDGILEAKVREFVSAGVRLLGPTEKGIRLATDKFALSVVWRNGGVRTPLTEIIGELSPDTFPRVVKPLDGAGSTATTLVHDPAGFATAVSGHPGRMICQEFIPGRPASLAFLIGPRHTIHLVPTFQHLSNDGHFHYLGGELPIPPTLAERAVRLGTRAVACVPGLLGYVGVDLVLGAAADGSQDYAIEINPRLTTSYVGLRALADFNLAGAMLAVARGIDPPPVRWKPGTVRFDPAGGVSRV